VDIKLTNKQTLPSDGFAGTLVGRAWIPGIISGPSVVVIKEKGVFDISRTHPTMSDLLSQPNPVDAVNRALEQCNSIGSLDDILSNTHIEDRDHEVAYFLSPIDMQAIKACGVTFARSMIERVIEEKAGGDASAAEGIRKIINDEIGGDIAKVVPGSKDAEKLKAALIKQGMWSQYIEVGIGPYAEVFTKSQPTSAVGTGAEVGVHPESGWNNPEPELVLLVNPEGKIIGATLGNDVNLRDFEGRSALLLGKAKDNNASCSIGPFIRLLDDTFSIDDMRNMEVSLEIHGEDGFELIDKSSISQISRDITDLVSQTIGENHQYPDGIALFTGTMFAPTKDRDRPGQGFTHKIGDVVTISSAKLGSLVNRVNHSNKITPWTFGATALMKNLAKRKLL